MILIIFSLKKARLFILTNLNPFYLLYVKFGWHRLSGSEEVTFNVNVKSLRTDKWSDRRTPDKRWSEKALLSYQVRWAKNVTAFFI